MGKYNQLKETNFIDKIEIRIRGQKGVKVVEWAEGVTISKDTIPEGKHSYETKHGDNDWAIPISIVPEGCRAKVNYCGLIISDEALEIEEETDIMFLGFLDR